MERIIRIIKTQLAKMMESFKLPWLKALLLVPLNLCSTPTGKYHPSPFDIVTSHPMHLNEGMYKPAM